MIGYSSYFEAVTEAKRMADSTGNPHAVCSREPVTSEYSRTYWAGTPNADWFSRKLFDVEWFEPA